MVRAEGMQSQVRGTASASNQALMHAEHKLPVTGKLLRGRASNLCCLKWDVQPACCITLASHPRRSYDRLGDLEYTGRWYR